jgi:Xaa-Pro aminopeptidase
MFTTDTNTPGVEIDNRIRALQAALRRQEIDGALILQPVDLFYFSGTIQQSHLYIPAEGEPLLMARKSFERAQAESPLRQIVPFTSPKKLPDLLRAHGIDQPRRLGLEMDVLPANLYLMYIQIFHDAQIVDIAPAIRALRAIKSPYEQAIIVEACRRADQVAGHVAVLLRDGITEIALAGQLEAFAREHGHQGIVRMRLWGNELFYGHLMSGASAAVPSYLASPTGGSATSPAVAQGAGFNVIRPHEPVLVDYVFAYQGYIADHTRIFCLGDIADNFISAHAAMLAVQSAVKGAARPGVQSGAVYDLALETATAAGWGENFMGVGAQRIRFVGHGIGLELDEFPFLAQGQTTVLEEGMIVALEPKAILPCKGVVGVENTHLVTSQGLQQLTHFPESIQRIDRV